MEMAIHAEMHKKVSGIPFDKHQYKVPQQSWRAVLKFSENNQMIKMW